MTDEEPVLLKTFTDYLSFDKDTKVLINGLSPSHCSKGQRYFAVAYKNGTTNAIMVTDEGGLAFDIPKGSKLTIVGHRGDTGVDTASAGITVA